MPNRIKWTIVHFKPPEAMTLNGDGRGGVKVKLIGKVKPSEKDSAGSTVTFDVHLGGPALFGPIGMVVAGALKGDIRESLNKFKNGVRPGVTAQRRNRLVTSLANSTVDRRTDFEFQRHEQRIDHRERQRGHDRSAAVLDVPRAGVNRQAPGMALLEARVFARAATSSAASRRIPGHRSRSGRRSGTCGSRRACSGPKSLVCQSEIRTARRTRAG